jgi:hypothetical protein
MLFSIQRQASILNPLNVQLETVTAQIHNLPQLSENTLVILRNLMRGSPPIIFSKYQLEEDSELLNLSMDHLTQLKNRQVIDTALACGKVTCNILPFAAPPFLSIASIPLSCASYAAIGMLINFDLLDGTNWGTALPLMMACGPCIVILEDVKKDVRINELKNEIYAAQETFLSDFDRLNDLCQQEDSTRALRDRITQEIASSHATLEELIEFLPTQGFTIDNREESITEAEISSPSYKEHIIEAAVLRISNSSREIERSFAEPLNNSFREAVIQPIQPTSVTLALQESISPATLHKLERRIECLKENLSMHEKAINEFSGLIHYVKAQNVHTSNNPILQELMNR